MTSPSSAIEPISIAVVDHLSAGGVSRFTKSLVTHLAMRGDVRSVAYLVSLTNIERDGLDRFWVDQPKVTLHPITGPFGDPAEPPQRRDPEPGKARRTRDSVVEHLRPLKPVYLPARAGYRLTRRVVERLGGRLPTEPPPPEPPWYTYSLAVEARRLLDGFDVVYLAWPYFVQPFRPSGALVATFHDFHFKRFPDAYPIDQLELADAETRAWLSLCDVAVFSTEFMRREAHDLFPDLVTESAVVFLAPYSSGKSVADFPFDVLTKKGIRRPYVFYSGGRSAHKNIASLVRAIGLTRGRGIDVQLVVTGHGTDVLGTASLPEGAPGLAVNEALESSSLEVGRDFVALGYVPEDEVDAITRNAALVVSASLYEAGCGPALDAWVLGTPVAFSGIPPFLEQLDRLGVEALVFDPRDALAIADRIAFALSAPDVMDSMATRSRIAVEKYTWADVSSGYATAFQHAREVASRKEVEGLPRHREDAGWIET